MFRSINTLRSRFIFLAIMIVGCLTVILSSVITTLTDKQIKQEIGTALAQDAFQTSDKLDNFMWSRLSEVKLLSDLDTLKNPQDPKKIRELLQKLNQNIPYYSWIGMLDPKGTVIASTNGILTGSNISQRPVYQEGLKGPFVGDVHEAVLLAKLLPKSKNGPLRFVDISVPVKNDKGVLTGILASHLSWEWAKAVEKSVLQPIKNKKIDIVVVSQVDNKVILGDKNMIGQTLSLKSIKNARNYGNSWALEKWPDGKTYLTGYIQGKGYMDYKGLGWTVLVRQPLSVAYAPIAKLKSWIIMIGIACGIIFALAAFLIARKVYKPLQEITEVANRIREGKTITIPIMKGIKEIEILSSSLRDLIQSLVKTETKLNIMDSLAKHDSLTGLYNRMALDDHIHQAMAEAKETDHTLSILYIDLDNFKPVNDTFGHHIGDELLKEVAKVLERNIRGKDFAARIGGDEFVLALMTPKVDPIKVIRSVSHRIIHDLREPFCIEGNIVKIGCSIGGAVWPHHCDSVIDVMRLADESLYSAKRSGKNRLSIYGTSDHQVVYL